MPGFDSKRFVGITEQEKDDFICGICLGILNNPFIAKCCKQLYCFDCINEWLVCSMTCPYCRSCLKKEDLKSCDNIRQLMSSMEIQCEFNECQTVVQLKDLDTHTGYCIYNPLRKCDKCDLTIGDIDRHNCIELLIAEKEKFRIENIELKSKITEYKERIFEEERHCWDDPLWCM